MRLILVSSNVTTQASRSVAFPRDEPLDQRAEERIRSAAVGFRASGLAYTSPALRARQTALALGLDAIAQTALRDYDYGRWTGCSLQDLQTKEPDAFAVLTSNPHAAPHGGESVAAVVRRVGAWLDARAETGRLIAVTHPAIVRAAVMHVLGTSLESFWRIDVEPFSRTELSRDGRRWMLRSLNAVLSGGKGA